jgi:ABC-2 type transport system ATP-binding protein
MKNVLRIEHLSIRRSRSFTLLVDKISVRGGNILCIAGPNGSGKTTLIETLVGVLTASSVDIAINGHSVGRNLKETRALTGYIPDDEGWFIKELCASEYFALLMRIYGEVGIPVEKMRYRIKHFANQMRFTNFDQPLESLSHGNKKKVQFIAGLMHEPKLIVIDELRNSLDPLAIISAENVIRAEAARGACIVAATHDLWWAERIAQQTMLLIDGKVALYKKTDAILEEYGSLEKIFVQLATQEPHERTAV